MTKQPTFADAIPIVLAHYKTHLGVAKALGYDDLRNVSPWMKGDRPFPPEHCVTLEMDSGRAITRQQLRPEDWQKFWPNALAQPIQA